MCAEPIHHFSQFRKPYYLIHIYHFIIIRTKNPARIVEKKNASVVFFVFLSFFFKFKQSYTSFSFKNKIIKVKY